MTVFGWRLSAGYSVWLATVSACDSVWLATVSAVESICLATVIAGGKTSVYR